MGHPNERIIKGMVEAIKGNPGMDLYKVLLSFFEDKVFSCWTIHDIELIAEEHEISLTEEQKSYILDSLILEFDASQGINWDVIRFKIMDAVKE
jgi:hypothetical protein